MGQRRAGAGAHGALAEVAGDWLGTPTRWTSSDSATNARVVREAGFHVGAAALETSEEDGVPVTFLWVAAYAQ